jgi:hypothetical protein
MSSDETPEVFLYLGRTPTGHQWRCSATGKIAFKTGPKAAKYRKRSHNRGLGAVTEQSIRAYVCELCGYWHNTSMSTERHNAIIEQKQKRKMK